MDVFMTNLDGTDKTVEDYSIAMALCNDWRINRNARANDQTLSECPTKCLEDEEVEEREKVGRGSWWGRIKERRRYRERDSRSSMFMSLPIISTMVVTDIYGDSPFERTHKILWVLVRRRKTSIINHITEQGRNWRQKRRGKGTERKEENKRF